MKQLNVCYSVRNLSIFKSDEDICPKVDLIQI